MADFLARAEGLEWIGGHEGVRNEWMRGILDIFEVGEAGVFGFGYLYPCDEI